MPITYGMNLAKSWGRVRRPSLSATVASEAGGVTTSVATGSSPIVGVGIGVAVCPQASNISSAERSITSAGSLEITGGTLQPLGIIACLLGWHQQDSCFLRLRAVSDKESLLLLAQSVDHTPRGQVQW